ncbi:MAG: hypothetical protein AAGI01_10955 [Myxococcota bacterium]
MKQIRRRWRLVCMMAALVMGAPSVVVAQEDEDADDDVIETLENEGGGEEEGSKPKKKPKRWNVNANVGGGLGLSTFVRLDDANDSLVSSNPADSSPGQAFTSIGLQYGIGAGYRLNKQFSLSLGTNLSQSLVNVTTIRRNLDPEEAGPGDFEDSLTRRPFRIGDTNLGLRWVGYNIESIETRFTAGGGMRLPSSRFSRRQTLLAGFNARVGLTRQFFGKLRLSVNYSGSKNWHLSTNPQIRTEPTPELQVDGDVVIEQPSFARQGGPEDIGTTGSGVEIVAIGLRNVSFSHGLSLGAAIPLAPKVNLSVNYRLNNAYAYRVTREIDEFTSRFANTSRWRQSMGGSVAVAFPVWKKIGGSVSLSNGGQPKTADNRSFRFPFWDFEGGIASGRTRLGFGFGGGF